MASFRAMTPLPRRAILRRAASLAAATCLPVFGQATGDFPSRPLRIVVPFAVPADSDGVWQVVVTTESGRRLETSGRLFELPADSHAWPEGRVHCIRRATIWLDQEYGYHHVAWQVLGARGETFAIAAPTKSWGAPGDGPKRWGVFAPVYGLANASTGQAGRQGSGSPQPRPHSPAPRPRAVAAERPGRRLRPTGS